MTMFPCKLQAIGQAIGQAMGQAIGQAIQQAVLHLEVLRTDCSGETKLTLLIPGSP